MRMIGPDELKAERTAAMGAELGETFHALTNELSWILLKCYQYNTLFGTKPERIELLNKAAPLFFVIVQDTLWDDILIHLSRLTDSPTSVGKANLSVRRLPGLIRDSAVRADVEVLVRDAVASSDFARDWRNRRIAHSDLSLAIAVAPAPLAHASRVSVIAALDSLSRLLKRIHQHYFNWDIDLNLGSEPGDAESMLSVLADGVEAGRARWQRFEEGKATPDDWNGPPKI